MRMSVPKRKIADIKKEADDERAEAKQCFAEQKNVANASTVP